MKITRYPIGQTTLGQIERARAGVMSPAQAAGLEAGKYGAMAEIAGAVSETALKFQEVRNKTIDADDAVKTQRSILEFENAQKRAKAQIENDPNATAEDYEAAMQSAVQEFISRGENISDRNREQYMEEAGFMSRLAIENAVIDGAVMRANKARDASAATVQMLKEERRFDEAATHVSLGQEMGLYSEEQANESIRQIENLKHGEELFEQYRQARQAGTEDRFLQSISGQELPAETMEYFADRKKTYDQLTTYAENQQRLELQLDYNKFLGGIDHTTSQQAIDAYVRSKPELKDGQISALYKAEATAKHNQVILANPFRDNASEKTRKVFNDLLGDVENQPIEQVLVNAHNIAAQHQVTPEYMTNILDNFANQDATPQQLVTAGDAYEMLQMDPATAGVSLPLRDRTRAQLEMYVQNKRAMAMEPMLAAEVTKAHFAGVTDDYMTAAGRAWESTEAGSLKNKSPYDIVMGRISENLSDEETPEGALFVADLGEGWFNMRDQYGDFSVALNAQMEYEMGITAERLYKTTMSEEVAYRGAVQAARANGYRATDINFEVPGTTGETRREYEIQKNPITWQGDNRVPPDTIRAIVREATPNGIYAVPQFAPEGTKPESYSIDDLHFGEGRISRDGENAGQMEWPLSYMGSPLINPETRLPVVWYFSPEDRNWMTQ